MVGGHPFGDLLPRAGILIRGDPRGTPGASTLRLDPVAVVGDQLYGVRHGQCIPRIELVVVTGLTRITDICRSWLRRCGQNLGIAGSPSAAVVGNWVLTRSRGVKQLSPSEASHFHR